MKPLLAGIIVAFLAFLPAALAQVESIPMATYITAHPESLTFPGGRPQRVVIEIQLSEVKSGEPVARPGDLYFTSTYEGIEYPEFAALDENGYARVTLTVRPPSNAELDALEGRIVVLVVIDEEDADDTIEGRVVLKLSVSEK